MPDKLDWIEYDRRSEYESEQRLYGKSMGYDQAYNEGYKAKYEQWNNRENPYIENTPEANGFDYGYAEAVAFSC